MREFDTRGWICTMKLCEQNTVKPSGNQKIQIVWPDDEAFLECK